MRFNITVHGLALFLFSACNPFDLKPLDLKTVKSGRITARWFHTSDITTVHNHVEINTNRGWIQVLEGDGNAYKIYDVLINKDTVIIQTYKDMFLYELTSNYSGIHVKVDSSISLFTYMKRFQPENAKYYEDR
jgi:hypothetical protein